MIQQPQSLFPALRRRTPLFEPAYRAWVGAGRKRPQIWRLIPGLLLIFGCWALTSFLSLYLGGLWALAGSGVEDVDPVEAFFSMPSRASGLFVLSSFSGIWIGVWLALRLCHRRSFTPLLAARGHWRTAELFLGLVIALGFASFVMVLNGLSGAEVPFKVSSLTDWGLLLVPLLALVVVQAGGEELIFRGYLQQQLAARSRNPLIWLVLPSILFGLLHPIGIGYVFSTFLFAMAAGVIVWRTGSLAGAIGVHTGNNLVHFGLIGPNEMADSLFQADWADQNIALSDYLVSTAFFLLLLIWGLSSRSPFPFKRDP